MISDGLGIMTFACSLYFLAGVVVRQSGITFTNVFQSSSIAIIAFSILAAYPQNLLMEVSGGVLMVFLFSPIFTFLCKPLVPVLLFDSTGLIFLFISLLICISGSLAMEWILDKTELSRYFYAKQKNHSAII